MLGGLRSRFASGTLGTGAAYFHLSVAPAPGAGKEIAAGREAAAA